MHLYDLLDDWPPSSRDPLLAATAGVLALASVGLPLAGLDVVAYDVAVGGLIAILALGWIVAGSALRPMMPSSPEAAVRHRGLIAERWRERAHPAVRLPEVDPSFSLLAWTSAIRRALAAELDGVVGPVSVIGTKGAEVTARALHRPGRRGVGWVEARLVRDDDTDGAEPRRGEVRFRCLDHRPSGEPVGAVEVDFGWPAARRALFARDEALGVEGFDVLFAQINDELDRLADADGAERRASPYLTAEGALALGFWADGPGLPARGDHAAWLCVEEDAWHERIEVQCGARVLGLCREVGDRGAPWRLWRLRRGA